MDKRSWRHIFEGPANRRPLWARRITPDPALGIDPFGIVLPIHSLPVNPLAIHISVCIIKFMRFTWHESKRKSNLKKHGLDFADAEKVFAGPMAVFEDARDPHGEQRMIGIGLLDCLTVSIVHVESDETIRIISMRKADGDEINLFYQTYGVL